jgi:hypothetical protein
MAAPGIESLRCKKHLKQWGATSRKVTRRFPFWISISAELWHTTTSYFRLHCGAELRGPTGRYALEEEAVGMFNADEEDGDNGDDDDDVDETKFDDSDNLSEEAALLATIDV